jgi:hypothetical protein
VGDLWAEIVFPGRTTSLASLLAICVAAIWYHRRMAARTEAGYWIAIVAMRAAATNVADICTHDLGLGYVSVSALLGVLTLIAARFATVDFSRSGSPRVDGPYWTAMFIAGVFGTVAGDLIHHNIGLYNASAALCLLLAGLILIREVRAPVSMLLFWSIVMAERCRHYHRRCVGKPSGRRSGVPVASISTAPDHLSIGARPARDGDNEVASADGNVRICGPKSDPRVVSARFAQRGAVDQFSGDWTVCRSSATNRWPNIQLTRPPRGRWPFLFLVDVHPRSPSVRGSLAPLVHAPVEMSGRCSRLHRSRRSVMASSTIIITLLVLDGRVRYPTIRMGRRWAGPFRNRLSVTVSCWRPGSGSAETARHLRSANGCHRCG